MTRDHYTSHIFNNIWFTAFDQDFINVCVCVCLSDSLFGLWVSHSQNRADPGVSLSRSAHWNQMKWQSAMMRLQQAEQTHPDCCSHSNYTLTNLH